MHVRENGLLRLRLNNEKEKNMKKVVVILFSLMFVMATGCGFWYHERINDERIHDEKMRDDSMHDDHNGKDDHGYDQSKDNHDNHMNDNHSNAPAPGQYGNQGGDWNNH
jgi:hypothetical protein